MMNPGFPKGPGGPRQTLLICLGLALATVSVYCRVGSFEFLDYDDFCIFFQNSIVRGGLTWQGIIWGATTTYYEYWHPLMWWSHMLDCQLFGLNAGAHHLVNLAFHVANTLLVFAVFRRMTGMVWRSAVVAALFALHPLHVESVAWLAERKDLLSAFFWLLCVWAYALYVEKLKIQSPKSRWFYALALLMFLLGLLSKPMVVMLPFVLLLLDYWPLNRVREFGTRSADSAAQNEGEPLAKLVWEKWPFFALMVLFCFITWYTVNLGNHIQSSELFPLSARLRNLPVSYALYVWKTIWPTHLAVFYPMQFYVPLRQVGGAVFDLAVISWLIYARARSAPYLVFGWLMFLGVLLPTTGIISVGVQAMADR